MITKEEFYDKITHIVDDSRNPIQARQWSDEFFENLQIEYEDVIKFWEEQFRIADRERNQSKKDLKNLESFLEVSMTRIH